jgi:hypothetical protein
VLAGAAVVAACSTSPYRLPANLDDSKLEQGIASLRFRVASEPADGRAHASLARLELRAGRPGAALRHFEIARTYRVLAAADRPALANLYAQRLEARVAAGDGHAYEDARAAMALGASVAPGLRAEARFLAALHGFRNGHQWGLAEAATHLARAAALAPGDPRLASRDAQGAALPDLAVSALWLYRGGALRAAKDLLDVYVARGGRDPEVLGAFVAVRAWWGNADGKHDLGLDVRRAIAAQGVSLCPLARGEGELGCAGTLWDVARGDDETAALVRARAHALGWRTAEPGAAAAWTLLGLRGWLAGEASWEELVRARMDADALARSSQLPAHVAATVLRVAGQGEQAARKLDEALEQARDTIDKDALDPGVRALLVAEVAQQGRDAEIIDPLLDSGPVPVPVPGPVSGDDGRAPALELAMWRVAVVHARALGHGERVRALLERAPSKRARRAVQVHIGDLALWPEHAALWRIGRAYLDDPALADRHAGDFVDGAVYMGERAPLVAALFASLDATARAQQWWERMAARHPHDPQVQFELGAAVAQTADATRAQVHFMAAAAASGDAGKTNLRAARVLLYNDHALEAVAAARRALALTAPEHREPVLRLIVDALTRLGRHDEAADIRAQIRTDPAAAIESADWVAGQERVMRARLHGLEPGSAAYIAVVRELFVNLLTVSEGPEGADRARVVAVVLQHALVPMGEAAVKRVFAGKP